MKIENLLKQQNILDNLKEDYISFLMELKKDYPLSLNDVDKSSIINRIYTVKSKIPTINFYCIELIQNDILSTIYIPSNINYLKSLEYEIHRNKLLNRIEIFKKTIHDNIYDEVAYDELTEAIKFLKSKFINMYKKETNLFKDEIRFLYNLKNGKNIQG